MSWETVIGLEIHAQLSTKSKLFSGGSTGFGAEPNTHVDLIDMGLPGVLPVANKEAFLKAIRFGLATNAVINQTSTFDRKNYFYPDLPKGYQITQMALPIVGEGSIKIEVDGVEKIINITRAHLEEDAGKSVHGIEEGKSGIDLNRAGTPLLEIVTEPDMSSAEEAVAYAKKLHELVQWIGICDGNMQEGNFRCDVNVSVKKKGEKKLGTRREIKNLNSFKFIKQAVDYEVNWQIERLEDGGTIKQSTILFDPDSGETREMRSKEEANDYRYFPDPDLLPLVISQEKINTIKSEMYELPSQMKLKLVKEFGLSNYDADGITSNIDVANFFRELLSFKVSAKLASNWILTNLFSRLNESNIDIKNSPLKANKLAELILRVEDKTISNNAAKKVFDEIWDQEESVDDVIEKLGLKQISNINEVEDILNQVLKDNEAMVEEYKSGKDKAFNALIGQVMKASKGKANPGQVSQLLKDKLTD